MNKRVRTAAAAAAVAALVLAWFLRPRAREAPPADVGFTFCAGRVDSVARDTRAWSYPLVFGLLLSLAPRDGATLGTALDEANRRWESRANPFTEDLDDADPDDALARWLETAPASAGTAMAAAQTRYCAADKLCVAVVARGRACPQGFAQLGDDSHDIGRARFLAWPFGYAVWLRAGTKEEARTAARAIRSRIATSNRIAMVLHVRDDDEAAERVPALRERLRRHEVLRRAAALRSGGGEPGDAGDAPTPEATFPADLGELDVVVLPRLEATRDPDALKREVREAAPTLRVVAAPGRSSEPA